MSMQPLARPKGVTFVEVMLTVIMLSLLFGSANGVMSYSRRETEKGFWIQQAITQLRNTTRFIAMQMKQTSYPSTLIRAADNTQKVISFKEFRVYDKSGRLRNMEINPSDAYELRTVITGGGAMLPSFAEQTIMYFPICEPEKDFKTGYTAGNITWMHLVLRPSANYRTSGLGSIHMVEHQETYDTRSSPKRAYSLNKTFSKSIPVVRTKELITDVREVNIESFDINEQKGVYVTDAGNLSDPIFLKRTLISLSISCCHPKDKKIWMSDQCSVINNVELVELPSPATMELVKILSTGAGGSAEVKLAGVPKTVNVGSPMNAYKVKDILNDALVLLDPTTGVESYLTKLDE
ncbi:MAG TPA: hypothetical protein PLM07_03840 [Candidatus Rifleibacterium sp.]|nr:hypothetical protein [Candidatus Rifleibacterium sp.]HPT45016.1 hypothetical protein [Candidatus Rifleibacterium sp.]